MSSSIPPVPRMAPGTSKLERSGPVFPDGPVASAGSSRNAAASTIAQTGRFTNRTHRQPGPAEITPPRKTPATEAMPAIAPQAPSAFTRSVP
jgi:hypothetical protein